jgi:hypothetical protein
MDSDQTPIFEDSPPPIFSLVEERVPWSYAAALLAASIVGCILVVPFSATLLKQMKGQPQIVLDLMPLVMAIQVFVEIGLSILTIALGLGLGRSLGLVWPPLDGWNAGPERVNRMRAALVLSTGLGVILAAVFIGLAHGMMPGGEGNGGLVLPPWWSCLLASVGAGIREEVWLRLGLMTFLAWVITRSTRRTTPEAAAVWIANVAASLVFGAIHLPQAFALLNTSATMVAFVLIGNGVPGVVFGWLFWRKGLIAAMVCHTVFDIVTKVIVPLLTG